MPEADSGGRRMPGGGGMGFPLAETIGPSGRGVAPGPGPGAVREPAPPGVCGRAPVPGGDGAEAAAGAMGAAPLVGRRAGAGRVASDAAELEPGRREPGRRKRPEPGRREPGTRKLPEPEPAAEPGPRKRPEPGRRRARDAEAAGAGAGPAGTWAAGTGRSRNLGGRNLSRRSSGRRARGRRAWWSPPAGSRDGPGAAQAPPAAPPTPPHHWRPAVNRPRAARPAPGSGRGRGWGHRLGGRRLGRRRLDRRGLLGLLRRLGRGWLGLNRAPEALLIRFTANAIGLLLLDARGVALHPDPELEAEI